MDFQEKKPVPNLRMSANILSKMFFWWIFPLLKKGHREELTTNDLFDVLPEDQSGLLGQGLSDAWDTECMLAQRKGRRPRFYRALIKNFFNKYATLGLALMFDEWVLRVAQTIFLPLLISSLTDGSSISLQYLYASGIIVTTLFHTLVVHPSVFGLEHVGMKCRIACCSLIYRKALKLSKAAQGQTTVGQLVNLMSNDVNRFDINLIFLHYLYIGPIQCVIFMYLLWTVGELKFACLAGVGFIILLGPIQFYIGKLKASFRYQTALRTDKRGQIMSETITAIRVIKMYAWEKPTSLLIEKLRSHEVKVLRKTAYLRSFYHSLYISSSKLIPYFTILSYVLSGGHLRADRVFFMVTIYNTMQQIMVNFMPSAAAHIGELIVSMNRIEKFLSLDEKEGVTVTHLHNPFIPSMMMMISDPKWKDDKENNNVDSSIKMSHVHARWTTERQTLDDLSLDINGNKLVMVIGPVGSGKSSLLHTLISELPITEGKFLVNGTLSYASQEPWIFSGNIRQNILFGRPYDESRYRDVIHFSALEEDLRQLQFGEFTIVGERGVALSGGQKARVNLARALYQQSDIYLLDDPLSAVDARVSRHIFEKCIQRHLKDRLRILVTHQLQYLHQADYIVVLNMGKIMAQGTHTQLIQKGVDFVSLTAMEGGGGGGGDKNELKRNGSIYRKDEVIQISKNIKNCKDDDDEDKPETISEKMAGGSVTAKTYWRYFKAGGSLLGIIFLALGFILSQILYSGADYWLSYWITQADKFNCTTTETGESLQKFEAENYTNSSSSTIQSCDLFDNSFYYYIYTGIILLVFLVTKARATYFFQYCMNISRNVHDQMFASVVRAPTKFFDENPSGRIMNRFTKDLGVLDELLPPAFFDALSMFLVMGGVLVVIVISNYYLILPAILLIMALLLIRRFYLKTGRHVKRIEATTRSPVFTHLAATLHGLTTIRVSGSQNILIDQFDGLQNIHSSAWYAFISANRWFGIWLELISLLFLTFVTYGFLVMAGFQSFESGKFGLVISSAIGLTGTFQWGIRQSAETENLMTCAERTLEYSKLEPEAPLESKSDKKPPKNWPTDGEIEFKKVFLAYDAKDVLKNLSFEIRGTEKIGVVGRTGAGKSSIIASLFRLTEPKSGDILIDGVKICDLGLHDIRKNISIIPQDPILFSGSIRYNLDPFGQFKDDQLWHVIEEFELKDAVPNLDFQVSDGGSNFSVGQRQLLCLARAVLRQNKIIVMDEATANVDPRTDKLIQKTTRKKFANCTIITIAHRLHSIMDCERVLVLDNGQLKEYDHPHILLQNPNGFLTSMVAHTGQISNQILRKVASETYTGRRGSFVADNISLLSRASFVMIDPPLVSSSTTVSSSFDGEDGHDDDNYEELESDDSDQDETVFNEI